jgi:hypothetical protein
VRYYDVVRAIPLLLVLCVAGRADANSVRPVDPPKSPRIGFALAVGSTVGGVGLLALADHLSSFDHTSDFDDGLQFAGGALVLLGPSAGQFYVGRVATLGLGVRFVAASAFLFAGAFDPPAVKCVVSSPSSCATPDDSTSAGIRIVSATVFIVGAAYDVMTAPGDIKSYNDDWFDARLTLAPIKSGVGYLPGIGIVGQF